MSEASPKAGKPPVTVTLSRVGPAAFEAHAGSGGTLVLDGAPEIGGQGRGMRPMELLATSLAGCAAMDVVHILERKQREPLEGLSIEVRAVRADATLAPFTEVELHFRARSSVGATLDGHKLERAVQLSVEKYCSAIASLDPAIAVRWRASIEG